MPKTTHGKLTHAEIRQACNASATATEMRCPLCEADGKLKLWGKEKFACYNVPPCDWAKLKNKLRKDAGMDEAEKPDKPAPTGLTVAQFAAQKHFPVGFLTSFYCMQDKPWPSAAHIPAVLFPAMDETNTVKNIKFRLGNDSASYRELPEEMASKLGLAPYPFGVMQVSSLLKMAAKATGKPTEYVIVLVEGESDQITLLLNGVLALGIPGKNSWKDDYVNLPLLKNAAAIFVVQEPEAENFPPYYCGKFPGQVRVRRDVAS